MQKIKFRQSVVISAITAFVYLFIFISFIIKDIDEGAVLFLYLTPIVFFVFMLWGYILFAISKRENTSNIVKYILFTIVFELIFIIGSCIIFNFSLSNTIKLIFEIKSLVVLFCIGISYGTLFWIIKKTKREEKELDNT